MSKSGKDKKAKDPTPPLAGRVTGGQATGGQATGGQAALIEAVAGQEGRAFGVRVIRAGLSGNGNYYPDAVLREAVGRFEGVRVFAKSDSDHLQGRGKDVRAIIGKLTQCTFVEGAGPDTGEIHAVLQVLQSVDDWAARFSEALSRNMAELYGLSVDAVGSAVNRKVDGRMARVATAMTSIKSVDLIVEPGAGGGLVSLIEAQADQEEELPVTRKQIVALIEAKAPEAFAGKDVDTLGDDALAVMLREAYDDGAEKAAMGQTTAGQATAGQAATGQADTEALMAQVEARLLGRIAMREAVAASPLPDAGRERVVQMLEAQGTYDTKAVQAAIKGERDYLARFTESGRVSGLGATAGVEWGESRADKISAMLDAFFDPGHKDHKHARSIKACYREATGDDNVTGLTRDCDQTLMREALASGSWAEVLGDGITRRMVADYNVQSVFDVWRRMATVTSPGDFRVQERTRVGGYGDLPVVAEGADYTALTSPSDEKASYALAKRGGIETVTLEMITNDDTGAVRRVPTNLSRSAKRTLGKFVLDGVRQNAVIYDGKALGHADHGNLGAAALGSTSLRAGRLAMLGQAELGSNEPLSIGPRTLWVPQDLEDEAVDLFRRNTEQDKTFLQSLSLDVIPVWYWTDADDWALTADPLDIPLMEVGFLHGEEEPAIFVQDNPSVGSLFAADKITYKIRHIYGATVLDYRGFYVARVP